LDTTQAQHFLEIAARCHRLARVAVDLEVAAELKEIAAELTARAEQLDQDRAEPANGHGASAAVL
jgi:hypothetical protein